MKVTVGLVGHGTQSRVYTGTSPDGTANYDNKFIADTVTIYIDEKDENGKPTKDVENMHERNYIAVALAIARKRLQCDVFPVDIEKPRDLPKKPRTENK